MAAEFEWGFFKVGADTHMAPISNGVITGRHLLTMICPCGPSRHESDWFLIVHREADFVVDLKTRPH